MPTKIQRRARPLALCLILGLGGAACEQPVAFDAGTRSGEGGRPDGKAPEEVGPETGEEAGVPDAGEDANVPDAAADAGEDGSTSTSLCHDVRAEPVPARRAVLANDGPGEECPEFISVRVTRDRLFDSFETNCGGSACHVRPDQGDPLAESPAVFDLDREGFHLRTTLGEEALARILSPDPTAVMPPTPAVDGSQRPADDKYRILGERLKAWQERGFPDEFVLEAKNDAPCTQDREPFEISAELGARFTNIGSCLPDPAVPKSLEDMERLDQLFANAVGFDDLPEFLSGTDMVSLDSEALARRGVFSYAPTYTLFSDHALKMRYVRVPVGETIAYDPAVKDFVIPENTRFYKTFLKPVYDADGHLGYRKMETRLIVVRHDERLPNGNFRPRALRATYVWDHDEQTARRMDDPFENGEPFSDRACPYVVDERETRDPLKSPIGRDVSERCTYMTQDEMEDPSSGSIRHYAIPSSERCDQCHMGSSSRSYILGFNPWQVDRRPAGEGGVYDSDPYPDELGQLQRLIDQGVVSGIEPGEAKLEESQGERQPRTEHELRAQGYMMGNCAFCHNENGFPVVENPLLSPFDLFPDDEGGGIFEFPLERYSPRVKLGPDREVQVPYISPAFGNFARLGNTPATRKAALTQSTYEEVQTLLSDLDGSEGEDVPDYFEAHNFPGGIPDAWDPSDATSTDLVYLAPWRSLIWRNVYTPFSYPESGGLFLHMPRNVPGFDCRAHKIMASWMLSVPSRLQDPWADQPYAEVLPEHDGYDEAVAQAAQRVRDYLGSLSGQHCPDDGDTLHAATETSALVSAPTDEAVIYSPRLADGRYQFPLRNGDGVPDHAHWVVVDTTSDPNRWNPRRPNWASILATGDVAPADEAQARVIEDLQSVRLSDAIESFALQPEPMGLWAPECEEQLAACDPQQVSCQKGREALSLSPSVQELAAQGPQPMTRWTRGLLPSFPAAESDLAARVHFQSRGQAVFQAICQNCHGAAADSKSPLTTTILELTGGQTRVANFVDGLFGPRWAPGLFAAQEFRVGQGATPQDWQARYLLFMTLGGTLADIPQSVLGIVGSSPFYGGVVDAQPDANAAANMLQAAETLCSQLHESNFDIVEQDGRLTLRRRSVAGAFAGVGHYELWESICSFQNEPLVWVFGPGEGSASFSSLADRTRKIYRSKKRNGNWVYPPDQLVGNQHGEVEQGITATNTMPWCVRGSSEDQLADIDAELTALGFAPGRHNRPYCPEGLFADGAFGSPDEAHAFPKAGVNHVNQRMRERWLRKGAFNAGLAAFYYLDRWTKGLVDPAPGFDECGD